MAIYRAKVESEYAVIPNTSLQDPSLSFEATGLLAMMLSLPEDWEIHKSWLQEQKQKCGREKLTRIMTELVEAGYVRKQVKQCDDGKMNGVDWFVYPAVQLECRTTENPYHDKPTTTKDTDLQSTQDTNNPQPPKGGDRIDYEQVKELWNHYASQNPDTANKVRVVSQKTKNQLPKLRTRYKAVCKELAREPKPFDQWLNNYIQAAIADASTWVGRNGDHAEWKANLEWVSRVKTYDNLLNKQEQ